MNDIIKVFDIGTDVKENGIDGKQKENIINFITFKNKAIRSILMKTRAEYALSEIGEGMRPILISMQDWGSNYKAQKEQNS